MDDSIAKNVRAYVDRLVAEAPPLSPAQRDRLTDLLSPLVTTSKTTGATDRSAQKWGNRGAPGTSLQRHERR